MNALQKIKIFRIYRLITVLVFFDGQVRASELQCSIANPAANNFIKSELTAIYD